MFILCILYFCIVLKNKECITKNDVNMKILTKDYFFDLAFYNSSPFRVWDIRKPLYVESLSLLVKYYRIVVFVDDAICYVLRVFRGRSQRVEFSSRSSFDLRVLLQDVYDFIYV